MGQGISLIGTWMQGVALPWLVYDLTHSKTDLGVVGFCGQILTFLLAPVAGVLADRWDRRRLVMWAQILALVQASALAVLTLGGWIQVWQIIVLSLFGGFIRAFEIPIRQSFLVEMIDERADLPNAIAMNSFLVNSSRLVGPALAGMIILLVGEGWCFLLNAVSYVAVIWALAAMRLKPRPLPPPSGHMLAHFGEGFVYAWRHPAIRPVLFMLGLVSLMGVPYITLMPVFAREILGGGPQTMGTLMAAVGVGAVTGALLLASRRGASGLGRLIVKAAAVFGIGLFGFAWSESYVLSLAILVAVGGGMMMQMATSNTILQTVTDEDKRGRVMSFYTMAFMGMGPFGALLAGTLAEHLGAPVTVALGGLSVMIGAVLFAALASRGVDATLARDRARPPAEADVKAVLESEPRA
jgi:MFS family permease